MKNREITRSTKISPLVARPDGTVDRPTLGDRVSVLRERNKLSLSQLAERTGISRSTISKVERNKMSLTYDKLYYLAKGLDVSISALFSHDDPSDEAQKGIGRRHVGTLNSGDVVDVGVYHYCYLCNDLVNKLMVPVVTEIKAKSLEEFGELMRHPGEEFSCVLEGQVEVHSKYYAPTRIVKGEYIYFDSGMPHAYLKIGDQRALLLTVCVSAGTGPENGDT